MATGNSTFIVLGDPSTVAPVAALIAGNVPIHALAHGLAAAGLCLHYDVELDTLVIEVAP